MEAIAKLFAAPSICLEVYIGSKGCDILLLRD
jgi:hypothetical protein